MSERGEVVVLLPMQRYPLPQERREVTAVAFATARRLVADVGGRVLGISKWGRGVDVETGLPVMKFTFAVDAPESTWTPS